MSWERILVGGGARSGKSRFALDLARQRGERRRFIATAEAIDDEMRQRIERHRIERGMDFETIEEPIDVGAALEKACDCDVVVVDCLTLWLSNLLLRGESDARIDRRLDALLATCRAASFHLILVTNEVGMGLVPETELGRRFRDVTGRAHQRLSEEMNEIYVAILGTIVRLKPSPVEIVGAKR